MTTTTMDEKVEGKKETHPWRSFCVERERGEEEEEDVLKKFDEDL